MSIIFSIFGIPMLPRITIVTPSFQQGAYLEECLRSVRGQDHPNVEHIVVDGGSTDGSKAIMERHADGLAWWCSEPDGGQSAAINKGLQRATGEVFAWLNSDDLLLPGALKAVGRWFAEEPEAWAHRGRIHLQGGGGPSVFPPQGIVQDEQHLFLDPLVVQQGTFFRTDVLRALGGVEEGLHHVMDLELQWQLLFRRGAGGLRAHNEVLAMFRLHAGSKTAMHRSRFLDEQATLLHGMLVTTGSDDLAAVIAMRRELCAGLRPVPVTPGHTALVRRMALHFMLKWDHHVMDRGQYDRMRALRDLLLLRPEVLSPQQRSWADMAFAEVGTPGWAAFRLKRKWKHLSGRR